MAQYFSALPNTSSRQTSADCEPPMTLRLMVPSAVRLDSRDPSRQVGSPPTRLGAKASDFRVALTEASDTDSSTAEPARRPLVPSTLRAVPCPLASDADVERTASERDRLPRTSSV